MGEVLLLSFIWWPRQIG